MFYSKLLHLYRQSLLLPITLYCDYKVYHHYLHLPTVFLGVALWKATYLTHAMKILHFHLHSSLHYLFVCIDMMIMTYYKVLLVTYTCLLLVYMYERHHRLAYLTAVKALVLFYLFTFHHVQVFVAFVTTS